MRRWQGIEEFVQVVDSGTFSAAAGALGVSKSHISQQVSLLEDRLGSRLLHRTTRKISLTEAGSEFYQQCMQVIEALDSAEQSVSHIQQSVKGQLRICSPHWLGETVVIPAMADFMRRHPELEMRLEISSRKVDLIDGGFDLAVQVGERKDINLVNKKLAKTRFCIVASPEYIRVHGTPKKPAEVGVHQTLLFEDQGLSKPWKLVDPANGALVNLPIKSHWRSNSGHALKAAAKQGLGLAYLPDYYLSQDLHDGALAIVLPEWTTFMRDIVAVYQHRAHTPVKVRLFIEHLAQYFSALS